MTGVLAFLIALLSVVSALRVTIKMSASSSQQPRTSRDRMSNNNMNNVKRIASLFPLLALTTYPKKASAGLFTSEEQDLINEISTYQKPVSDLLRQLTPTDSPNAIGQYAKQQILKGGKEDSDVVQNYLNVYIIPLQAKLLAAAPKLKVADATKQERLQTLPLLMKGHILELTQAIASQKATDQAREVEEVQETLTEFLTFLQTNDKYIVQIFSPTKPLSDAELFGPFGCGFYGKVRVPGSNACEVPGGAAAAVAK